MRSIRQATMMELCGLVAKMFQSHGYDALANQIEEAAEEAIPEGIPMTDVFFGEDWVSADVLHRREG